jgi:hypothetical protein
MECNLGLLSEVRSSDPLAASALQEGISHNLIRSAYWHQCSSVRPIPAFDPHQLFHIH